MQKIHHVCARCRISQERLRQIEDRERRVECSLAWRQSAFYFQTEALTYVDVRVHSLVVALYVCMHERVLD